MDQPPFSVQSFIDEIPSRNWYINEASELINFLVAYSKQNPHSPQDLSRALCGEGLYLQHFFSMAEDQWYISDSSIGMSCRFLPAISKLCGGVSLEEQ